MTNNYERLLEVVRRLRAPEGCPWDREQTHKSMTNELLEEAYELIEAINREDTYAVMDEMGDVLLQVVMQCQIAAEAEEFDIEQVCGHLADKLVRRHPHVFGDVQVSGTGEVLTNWEAIKKTEKGYTDRKSALDGIPEVFPALTRAAKLSKRAARSGFDWQDIGGVFDKLDEETLELKAEIEKGTPDTIRDELGDVLFVVCNLANKLGVSPEIALAEANDKFERRFRGMESLINDSGRELGECSFEEREQAWAEIKRTEKNA